MVPVILALRRLKEARLPNEILPLKTEGGFGFLFVFFVCVCDFNL